VPDRLVPRTAGATGPVADGPESIAMESISFNPFEDRLSRDIRNDLSESIVDVLAKRSLAEAETVAASYLQDEPAGPYKDYIQTRLERYARALDQIQPETSLLHRAAILWNLNLLFEVHEILEPPWMVASGNRKLILQALIRAVGVYINLELDYRDRAAKIAAKALPVLTELQSEVSDEIGIDELISGIEQLSSPVPKIQVK